MLQTLKVGGKEFRIDPQTNFWGIGDVGELENLFGRVKDEILAEMRELRFNTNILLWYVNPTDACNARCAYCYLPQQVKSRGRSMDLEELESLIEKASAYFASHHIKGSVIFHGTEPLLIKDILFKVIAKHAADLHFGIQTNGTLLDQKDIEFLVRHGINVGISLDSPIEKNNDSLRGQGHFQKIARLLDWFDGYKRLNVVTTITSRNVADLAQMVQFLHARKVGLCLMNPVRGTQEAARALRPDTDTLTTEFLQAVEEAIRLTKEGQRIVVGDFANVLLAILAPSARVMMCDISPCGGGRRFFSITADGSAWPCGEFIGMEPFCGGNIWRDSLDDILCSDAFGAVRERVVEKIPECADCVLRNVCGAPCPAEILSTDGTMYSKSPYCDFYKKVAEHAFEVIYRQDVEHVLRKSAFRQMYRLASEDKKGCQV